jgi:hypothetical protein
MNNSFLKVKTIKSDNIFSNEKIVTLFIPISSIQSIEHHSAENYANINLMDKTSIKLPCSFNEDFIENLLNNSKYTIIDLSINQDNKSIIPNKKNE